MTWQAHIKRDPRSWLLEPNDPGVRTLALIREKPDSDGRGPMEHDYTGKARKSPSKWVTLRALRVLQAVRKDS